MVSAVPEHPTCRKCEVRNPGPGEWFYCLSTGKQIRPSRHCAACDSHEPGGPVTVIPGIRRQGEEGKVKRILRKLNESDDPGASAPENRGRRAATKSEGDDMSKRTNILWHERASATITDAPDDMSLQDYLGGEIAAGRLSVPKACALIGTPATGSMYKRFKPFRNTPTELPSLARVDTAADSRRSTVPVDTDPVDTVPVDSDVSSSPTPCSPHPEQSEGEGPGVRPPSAVAFPIPQGWPLPTDLDTTVHFAVPGDALVQMGCVAAFLETIGCHQYTEDFAMFARGWSYAQRKADAA